ncbi:MAG TPA: M20/M25/M40 family metallo-hydrolase [Dehalococcoidia bacterium]|jgi:acetylornithine deacetylase/succinyl-diaminopimelate desuccinylase-like protein
MAGNPTRPAIDWPAVQAEALDLFIRYLRIASVNPPGDEAPAARFLGGALEASGVPCEYIETQPNREVVVARLSGNGAKGTLMLCNHLDVVPVEEQFWDVPAFAGIVKDGFVFGRGAVDMKGAAIMQLMAFLLLARSRVPLARDIVFCGVPDEEAGGRWGMQWLCEHRPDLVNVEYELNEGGMGMDRVLGKPARIVTVAVAEKKICGLRLRAVGKPGHGSVPHRDNSLVHLSRAIARLADWEREPHLTPVVAEYLHRLATAGLLEVPDGDLAKALPALAASHPRQAAMYINTLNATTFHSGIKINVIPALSEATLDCRLLPDQDPEEWRKQVVARIDDPRIEVEFADFRGDTIANDWDTELFRVIQQVVNEAMEDAVVTPVMTTGGTDNRFLRERGIPAYGFIPALLSPDELAGFHGNNEKLSVENFNLGCELTYEVVRRFCAAE